MDSEYINALIWSFVISLVIMLFILLVTKQNAQKKGEEYKFNWIQFIAFTLVMTIVCFVLFIIFVKIGIFGIIILIGAPGALIAFLRKG